MTNSKRPILAVVGATGAQGGGLVRAALSDPQRRFDVRAITRDPSSEGAQQLARLGAEVVAADVDDLASLERAFAGAAAAFCVTFYWAHMSPDREFAQAQNLAHAAKRANVSHVVWSTLEDTRKWVPLDDGRMPTLMGRYKVPHFDAKGAADSIFWELGVPTTYLKTAFYWDNFIHFGLGPKRAQNGVLTLTFPLGDRKMPCIAGEDIGACALSLFDNPDEFQGKVIGIAGEHLSGEALAVGLSRALGEPVRYQDVSPETYRAFGFPAADDIGNMFQFKRDFEADYCAARDVEKTRALYAGLQSFAGWLVKNAQRIPLA